jgi:hypothetical protein
MQLSALSSVCAVCVFITVVPITKLIERGGGAMETDMCYERLRARDLCELVCPSRMCVYYCRTYYKAARVWCVFITARPIIKVCAGGEGDSEGQVL